MDADDMSQSIDHEQEFFSIMEVGVVFATSSQSHDCHMISYFFNVEFWP